jgi:phosphoglycerate dehydrogenase-like enzyme
MASIAILDDYQGVAFNFADWSALQAAHRIEVFTRPFASDDEAAAALAPFDILAVMRERTLFPASLIARLPNLRFIATSGMRNAALDIAALAARGITVSGTSSPGHPTSELTIGLMIALSRHIVLEAHTMAAGGWQTTVGRDLRGRTLGLIGLGRLGTDVARVGQAFGMPVIAWSQNLTEADAASKGVQRVEKDDLFRTADVISIHTRLSQRTQGLVDGRAFGLMKRDALLINTSRGPIVDGAALREALTAGRIGGAALDVYDVEPVAPDDPLRTTPRTLLTPHIGYVTEETYRVFYGGQVEAITAWLAGAPIRVVPA